MRSIYVRLESSLQHSIRWRLMSGTGSGLKFAKLRNVLPPAKKAPAQCLINAIRLFRSAFAAWLVWSGRTVSSASKTSRLWHERDISHSSAERVVLPDSSITLDYILQKATSLISGLRCLPGTDARESERDTRVWCFSGQLLLALTRKGVSRETAYEWVQRNAMKVWDEKLDFQELVSKDKDIARASQCSMRLTAHSPQTLTCATLTRSLTEFLRRSENKSEPSAAACELVAIC